MLTLTPRGPEQLSLCTVTLGTVGPSKPTAASIGPRSRRQPLELPRVQSSGWEQGLWLQSRSHQQMGGLQ